MKETMETLKCKAVHVAAGAAQTARLVALISKKKFAILAEQDKIRRCYTQLGKVYYKDYVTDEEPDDAEYDPLCERISQSFRRCGYRGSGTTECRGRRTGPTRR